MSWSLMGSMEKLLLAYAQDESFSLDLSRVVTDIILGLIETAIEQGADAILLDGDLAYKTTTLMSPDTYRRLLKPYHRQCVETAHKHDIPIFKHCDGNFSAILEDFLECGFNGLHPIQPDCMDIAAVKDRVQGRAAVFGNIDCVELLPSGSPEDVTIAVKETIKSLAPGGGYVLSSSNSIHPGCKPENVIAMLRAVNHFGHYPIHI
jgi:uroporphyrinogen decarboxylase